MIHGASSINPARTGTKLACWYPCTVAPGETLELRLRLARTDADAPLDLAAGFDDALAAHAREADEWHAALRPAGASEDEARILRQAFAGVFWSQQFHHYDVSRWLDGDPAQPPPPASRRTGRNAGWRLLRLFLRDGQGRRPALGAHPRFRDDPDWRDHLLFYQYFHGDTGEGLGASHQTGWTALVGALIANRRRPGGS